MQRIKPFVCAASHPHIAIDEQFWTLYIEFFNIEDLVCSFRSVMGSITQDSYRHQDQLWALSRNLPLSEKLRHIHDVVKTSLPHIDRIAFALYDPDTDLLKTFLHSSGREQPLWNYQFKLSDADSLADIVKRGKPRVINDMQVFADGSHEHTKRIATAQYLGSYTLPVYVNETFFGFIFFNSTERNVLDETALNMLDIFGHLISHMVANELAAIKTLLASVKTARQIARERDPETGAHLNRMAHYARLIARKLARQHGFTDEYIEHVFLFSPLHDIGKIGVPDNVLLKEGSLDNTEFDVMKTHALKGRQIIDEMISNFELNSMQYIEILRNIAEYHHEAINGQGYPYGLRDEQIPIEARIVAVADVFDALTSERPYKEAWSNDDAFAMLVQLADIKLDRACVQALVEAKEEVESIQRQFVD